MEAFYATSNIDRIEKNFNPIPVFCILQNLAPSVGRNGACALNDVGIAFGLLAISNCCACYLEDWAEKHRCILNLLSHRA